MTALSLSPDRPYSVTPQHTQSLPFRVRLAQGTADLEKALALRALAYGRHLPELADSMALTEPDDLRPDALLLMAESKDDGRILGSMRLINNLHRPIRAQEEATLPARFQGRRLAEAKRLNVMPGTQGRMVSTAMCKALYEICYLSKMDEVLINARSPVDRMYRLMQFEDALDGGKLYFSDAPTLALGLYSLPVRDAESKWRSAQCPLYGFMALTAHPDIQIDYDVVHQRFSQLKAVNHGMRHLDDALV